MKITKIEKKKRLYLIEIDEGDKLYVTEDTIVRFMLSKDKEITSKDLEQIKAFAQFSYGKNLALYYLSFKQRTEKEIRDYLTKYDLDRDIISKVIKTLKDEKWINDLQYIESVIQQNLHSGDKGPYVLKQKLLQKGIDRKLIDSALENTNFSTVCRKTAEKVLKRYQGKLPQRALRDKLSQTLTNKGFSYQEVKAAIAEFQLEDFSENEEELIYKELDKHYRKYSKKYDGYELRQRLTQALARKGFDFDTIKSALREYL